MKKKPFFPVSKSLHAYLKAYQREGKMCTTYHDLTRFTESVPLMDKSGKDTLWECPIYPPSEIGHLHAGLKEVYAILKASGNLNIVAHKYIDRIDYCSFGNTHPFRIRIVNRLNDVYDYFYIKIADASRIYGLEIEEILSPNRVSYMVDGETLVEEHIPGIPGDIFARSWLHNPDYNPKRIAKEFVKFNERCALTLLGDMRAYNFVVQITPDFDDVQFRIRSIDFDQQFYEGNWKMYVPQFFKENFPYVQLGLKYLNEKTYKQYQQEEMSALMHRVRSSRHRLAYLRDVLKADHIAPPGHVRMLAESMAAHYGIPAYRQCRTMADIMEQNIRRVIRQLKV